MPQKPPTHPSLNRRTPHPTEPHAWCSMHILSGHLHLVSRCPSCGHHAGHVPHRRVALDSYSRQVCWACNEPFWIIPADYVQPRYRKPAP